MLTGAFTALITPFNTDGSVDFGRLAEQVEYQIAHGIDGVVPCGTTGESPTLDHEEHHAVIAAVVKAANRRCTVIAGTGSNATAEALALTQRAADAGADATLQVNPYYNKPSQEGLFRHFSSVADDGNLPVVLYNIPGRTGVTLHPDTVARLAQHDRIVAIKEATGSLDAASVVAATTDLNILSGDDSLTLPIMAVGGVGVVSVASNLLPDRVKALVDAAAAGDFTRARQLHLDLFPLCQALLSLDTNPAPIKAALARLGRDTGTLRLPLAPLSNDAATRLDHILDTTGLTQPAPL